MPHLRELGHSVVAAHRGIGVDTYRGERVTETAEGSDLLVDCVNFMTNNRHKALGFFSHSSGSIAMAAAENPGAALACLSIAFHSAAAGSKLLDFYQCRKGSTADEATRLMAESITTGERGTIEVAGPEISDFPTIAGQISAVRGPRSVPAASAKRSRPAWVAPIPLLGPLSGDGLILDSPRLSPEAFDGWLHTR